MRMLIRLRFWVRFTLFSILWALLTGWQPSSWGVGVVFISMASALSLYLAPKQRQTEQWLSYPMKLIPFLHYFLVQSLRGGWDTAKLALMPKSKLSPGFIRFHSDLANESQIFTFMQVLSLLPGTVSAEQNGRELTIHVLKLSSFNRAEIDDCQVRVSQLFASREQSLVDEGGV
jgi:multicomponent Na+:H+ antiporter subunit E